MLVSLKWNLKTFPGPFCSVLRALDWPVLRAWVQSPPPETSRGRIQRSEEVSKLEELVPSSKLEELVLSSKLEELVLSSKPEELVLSSSQGDQPKLALSP